MKLSVLVTNESNYLGVCVFLYMSVGQWLYGEGSVKGKGHFVLRQQSRRLSLMRSKVNSLGSD